ncbi:1-acyl-sn-glycerol-3-phosphate acyltransferase [Clostridium sp. USBA 49]|uniref:lysophospholipid acyltransferase family protein n=1 Tax=Clostridium TaxID=1485 RepID=UPI00099922FC|nr:MULTISPECIES: lysophospholipid acyltransferase family protein [Clostridium]SKA84122.1 1-acyl-sn-glycerol-3-phosphate acyltransferase [Clostridium sp. USBA 49]
MISPKIAKITDYLPDKVVNFAARKFVDYMIKKHANIDLKGKENLNNVKKPVIFISNHLSNSDALILDKVLKDQDITYVAGVKLSQNATTNLGVRLVKTTPLKPNTADKEGLTRIINLIKSGNNILIFPEGTRSRTASMIEAKKGLLLIAKITNVPIIPIGIWGTEKFLPINDTGNMDKESFQDANIGVRIGKPISIPKREQGEEKQDYEKRALTTLMKAIAELIPEEYRGVYK